MEPRFPLATSTWDALEYDAIQSVVDSGRFTMGAHVETFERDFAKFADSKYAIMCNSGSSANLLMIAALFYSSDPHLRLKHGDEVIVPAVSWSTTYFPLQQYGLKVKFVDIDLETLNFDLDALEKAIGPKTRMIFCVNLLGNPNKFSEIESIISGKNIFLIEDNCESLGATVNGKQAGSFGVMGSFSTFFSHHISTMEGGVVVTDNEELYQILLSIRNHGWTRNLPETNLITGTKDSNPFNESFKFVLPGYNLRPLEMSGAIGIEQIKKIPDLIKGRRDNAALFVSKMKDHPVFMIQEEYGESSWFGFSLVIRPDSGLSRDKVLEKFGQAGIEFRPIVGGNFVKNAAIQYFDYEISGSLPNAEYIDTQGFFIGNHHYDITECIEVIEATEF